MPVINNNLCLTIRFFSRSGDAVQRLRALVPARAHRHVERDPAAARQALGRRRRRRVVVLAAVNLVVTPSGKTSC